MDYLYIHAILGQIWLRTAHWAVIALWLVLMVGDRVGIIVQINILVPYNRNHSFYCIINNYKSKLLTHVHIIIAVSVPKKHKDLLQMTTHEEDSRSFACTVHDISLLVSRLLPVKSLSSIMIHLLVFLFCHSNLLLYCISYYQQQHEIET